MEPQRSDAIQLIEQFRLYLQSWKEPIDAEPEEAAYFRKKQSRPNRPVSISVSTPIPIESSATPKIAPPRIEQAPALPAVTATPLPAPLAPPKKEAVPSRLAPLAPSVPPPPELFRLPPVLATPIEAKPLPFQKLKSLFQKIAPNLPILAEPPSDAFAKKIHTRWKTKNQTAPITLLSFQEPPEQKALLIEIVKALDVCFGPARLVEAGPIEQEQQWEALLSVPELRWVLCCDYTLWQLPKLLSLFKEVPAQQTKTIGPKPLFLFPDLSLYLKDPLLKRSLWKALETTLKKR